MEIKKFDNNLIAFDFDNDYLNATDLLKAYNETRVYSDSNKRMDNFLRTKGVKEFIKVLESDALKSAPDFQAVIQSKNEFGRSSGTWVHRILAYRLAAWLSPEFELFVYKTFDDVLKDKLKYQQMQLDRLWDKEDIKDLYNK